MISGESRSHVAEPAWCMVASRPTVPTRENKCLLGWAEVLAQNMNGARAEDGRDLTAAAVFLRKRGSYIAGVSETHRVGFEPLLEIVPGINFTGSGPPSQPLRGSCGVGVIFSNESYQDYVAAGSKVLYYGSAGRVMAIRLKRPNGVTLHLIVVYAPTKKTRERLPDFEVRLDEFYDELTAAGRTARVEDFRIVLGDWNAKVGRNKRKDFRGRGDYDKDLARTLGPYGTAARNECGQRALEYGLRENLFFARSFFAGRGSQAARNRRRAYDTWFSNSNCFGGSGNIDHFLVSNSQFGRVKNALALRGGGMCGGTDHRCIALTLDLGPKRRPPASLPRPARIVYNWDAVQGDEPVQEAARNAYLQRICAAVKSNFSKTFQKRKTLPSTVTETKTMPSMMPSTPTNELIKTPPSMPTYDSNMTSTPTTIQRLLRTSLRSDTTPPFDIRTDISSTGNSWVFSSGNGHNGNGNGSLQQSPNFFPTQNFHFSGNASTGNGYGNGSKASPLQLSPYFSPTPSLVATPSSLGDSPVYTPHKWDYNRKNTAPYLYVGAREHRGSNPEIILESSSIRSTAPSDDSTLIPRTLSFDKISSNVPSFGRVEDIMANFSLGEIDKILILSIAAGATGLPKRTKPRKPWFHPISHEYFRLNDERAALRAGQLACRRAGNNVRVLFFAKRLALLRKEIHKLVRGAKKDFINKICDDAIYGNMSKGAWEAIKVLKSGLFTPKFKVGTMLRDAAGNIATTAKANLEIKKNYFTALFNQKRTCDPEVIKLLPQSPILAATDAPFTDEEITESIRRLRSSSAAGLSGLSPLELKLCAKDEYLYSIISALVRAFWDLPACSKTVPGSWRTTLLALFFKKGDHREAGNYRPIALVEAIPKLVGNILADRAHKSVLSLTDESLESNPPSTVGDTDYQNGFRRNRGTTDAIFTLKQTLRARYRSGEHTFVLFVDLVKAFDSVERSALLMVLQRFGFGPQYCRAVENLHLDLKIVLREGHESCTFGNSVGVKQGDTLAPVLFILFMHAVVSTLRQDELNSIYNSPWYCSPGFGSRETNRCEFYFDRDNPNMKMSCRTNLSKNNYKVQNKIIAHNFIRTHVQSLMYADDAAFVFPDPETMKFGARKLRAHFARWSLSFHVGKNRRIGLAGIESKSVMMFFPGKSLPGDSKAEVDKIWGSFAGGQKCPMGLGENIPFVDSFVYLGALIGRDVSCDDAAVKRNIAKASAAFGASSQFAFKNRTLPFSLRAKIYSATVLPILLYSSETWIYKASTWKLLEAFHHRCIRTMTNVNMTLTERFRIRTDDLRNRLRLESIRVFAARRVLGWLGHLARMNVDFMARQLLTAFVQVDSSIPIPGGNIKTYGDSCVQFLDMVKVSKDEWFVSAQNRDNWRDQVKSMTSLNRQPPR